MEAEQKTCGNCGEKWGPVSSTHARGRNDFFPFPCVCVQSALLLITFGKGTLGNPCLPLPFEARERSQLLVPAISTIRAPRAGAWGRWTPCSVTKYLG